MPQYLKLRKKVECGAQFIINQIGFDSRKISELRCYMNAHGMKATPLIGNVYLLEPARGADLFHEGRIPGVVVSDALLGALPEAGRIRPTAGRHFFLNSPRSRSPSIAAWAFAAFIWAAYTILPAIERILEIERSFAPDDWKQFAREIRFSRPGEFFYYAEDPATGLADPNQETPRPRTSSKHVDGRAYQLSKWRHATMFAPGTAFARWGAKVCAHANDPAAGTDAAARAGGGEQGRPLPLQGLRRLLAAGHRLSLPGIAMREEPAQRPVRRHARRPLRSGWLTAIASGCALMSV